MTDSERFPYEVVNGDELRAIIDEWEAKWNVTRPAIVGGRIGRTAADKYLFASMLLVEKTGLAEQTIWAIRRKHGPQVRKWVSLTTADKLLTAMGKNYLLRDGTLNIVPNPTLSSERYEAWRKERGCFD